VSATSLVAAAGLGLGLGIVTGMPLGVVNVAIVDAAVARRLRFAIGIGIGGAIADLLHAALAFVGIGQLVTSRPELVRYLAIASAVLIVAYVVATVSRNRATRGPTPFRPDTGQLAQGIGTGFVLTAPNPGALAAWVAVAASLWPDATVLEASVLAAGVGIGSAAWFASLARLVGRVPPEHKALVIVRHTALVALVAIAVVGLVRFL
jgi:arginine exporter protein ArgO